MMPVGKNVTQPPIVAACIGKQKYLVHKLAVQAHILNFHFALSLAGLEK